MILFKWHAALMAAGWVMVAAAVLIAATQRQRRWWLRFHRGAGLSGAVVILSGAAAAVATPLLGLLQFKIRERAGSLRAYHRLGGRILAGAALITLLLGLRLTGYL